MQLQYEKTNQLQKQNWKQMISNWQKEFIFTGFSTEFDNNDKSRNIHSILLNFAKEENLQMEDAGPPPVIVTHSKEESRHVEGEQNQGYKYPSVRFGTEEAGRRFAQWISSKYCEGSRGGIHIATLKSGEEAQAKGGGPLTINAERAVEELTPPKAALAALTLLKKIMEDELDIYSKPDPETGEWLDKGQHLTVGKSDLILFSCDKEDRAKRNPVAKTVFDLKQEVHDSKPSIVIRVEENLLDELKTRHHEWQQRRIDDREDLSINDWFDALWPVKLLQVKTYKALANQDPIVWNFHMEEMLQEEIDLEKRILDRVMNTGQRRRRSRSKSQSWQGWQEWEETPTWEDRPRKEEEEEDVIMEEVGWGVNRSQKEQGKGKDWRADREPKGEGKREDKGKGSWKGKEDEKGKGGWKRKRREREREGKEREATKGQRRRR
jgi:hypothetical protein